MNDQVLHTQYAKGIELMRRTEFFYWGQAMQGFGLQEIDINNIGPRQASAALGKIYQEMENVYGDSSIEHHFYTFGWSGLLSHKQRFYDAHEFFIALESLLRQFAEQGKYPKIRIIGYSHGGNVALDLGLVRQKFYPKSKLIIDELILLGVPLITETEGLINDPIFKEIYNVTSPHDRIQTIDLFSSNRIFSHKYFKNHRNLRIPENVTQISLKCMQPITSSKGCQKEEKRRICRRDTSNPAIISGNSRLLSNVSPGHIELWFFGWTPQHYRKNFILYPLPTLVTLPYIIREIKKRRKNLCNPHLIIADMRPCDNLMILKQYKPHRYVDVIPFIPEKYIKRAQEIAWAVEPHNYTHQLFNEHIEKAYKKATMIYNQSITAVRRSRMRHKQQMRMRMRRLRVTP
jgi:hypothetical protein